MTYMNNNMNFVCPKTGEGFKIDTWKAKVNTITRELEYFEPGPGWHPIVNPKNGERLIKSELAQIQMTSVKTETASR